MNFMIRCLNIISIHSIVLAFFMHPISQYSIAKERTADAAQLINEINRYYDHGYVLDRVELDEVRAVIKLNEDGTVSEIVSVEPVIKNSNYVENKRDVFKFRVVIFDAIREAEKDGVFRRLNKDFYEYWKEIEISVSKSSMKLLSSDDETHAAFALGTDHLGEKLRFFTEKIIGLGSAPELEEVISQNKGSIGLDVVVEKIENITIENMSHSEAGCKFSIPGLNLNNDNKSGIRSTLVISSTEVGDVIKVSTELEHDQTILNALTGRSQHWQAGNIHRINGVVEFKDEEESIKLINKGDKYNRLTFIITEDSGYYYIRGDGEVLVNVQKAVKFNKTKNPNDCMKDRRP